MQFNRKLSSLLLAALLFIPAIGRADDLLAEVPHDALGFVVVHNISALDAKVGQLATLLQRSVPRPLTFLQEFAGISDGLNANGDAMLVLFQGDADNSMQFCLWLPVSDYDGFLKSLKASTIDGVAAATVAGEDLVIARRGEWALIMDPDQRDRIAQLADASPAPPEMPAWKSWINANDVTVVAFSGGIRAVLDAANVPTERTPTLAQSDSPTRDTDANRRAAGPRPNRTPADVLENLKIAARKWCAAAPKLVNIFCQSQAIACGVRLDESGNATTSIRIALNKELAKQIQSNDRSELAALPDSDYESGGFVLNAAGHVPSAMLSEYAAAKARVLAAELRDEERIVLDESAFNRMLESVEHATAEVQTFAILDQPGAEPQPVYSNSFVLVRVASATTFVEHAREVMRLWNSASRESKSETKMVFDVEETNLSDRTAALYSLDMTALEGGAVVPEVRQAMEKLFGPQGKLRLWIVPTSDNTVLLAAATPDQVEAVLKVIDQKQPIEWNRGELSEVNALLPADADLRAFFDLHRYFDLQRRETMAIIGVPVIGGPLVRDFPASPPVGVAGAFRDGELKIDVAALAPTLKNADAYLFAGRQRGVIQIRPRTVPVPQAAPPQPAPQK